MIPASGTVNEFRSQGAQLGIIIILKDGFQSGLTTHDPKRNPNKTMATKFEKHGGLVGFMTGPMKILDC